MAVQDFYRRVTMEALAQDAGRFGIVHATSLGSVTIPVPRLVIGTSFLERWAVRQEPGGAHWPETSYGTYSPWVFIVPNAVVHSAAGIVCVGDVVIEETLAHTDPAIHGYLPEGDGIWIPRGSGSVLPGVHVSALSGAGGSYYHAMLDGVGRLSVIPDNILHAATGLLTASNRPATATWLQNHLCTRYGLGQTLVPDRRSLCVEQLVLASPNHEACNYHPRLAEWFEGIAANADVGAPPGLRRFFIDRRGVNARPLANETAVIEALEALGVQPIALENLSAQAQIGLFRDAELVVAPHGAGLANLLFTRPGCRVIELQMDAYCHWAFRRLSALKGLSYDCVVGLTARPWPAVNGPIHGATWDVSLTHVVAAVQSALERA